MKHVGVLAAIALGIVLAACGGSSSTTPPPVVANPATGAWSATIATATGKPLGSFTFNMMQNSTQLSGSNMNFSNMGSLGPCFGAGTDFSGEMGPGMMDGGAMNMTMSWTDPGGTQTNTLVLKGTMTTGMGSGSGTFTLTGQTPGCTSQSGDYSMSRMAGNGMM